MKPTTISLLQKYKQEKKNVSRPSPLMTIASPNSLLMKGLTSCWWAIRWA